MFKKKIFISFSGLDGSGKSTQINLLFNKLNKKKSVKMLHLFSEGSTLHSKIKKKNILNYLILFLKKQNHKIFGFRLKFYIAIILYILESWYFYYKIIFFEKKKYILLDRYYYDYFVNQISQEDTEYPTFMKINLLFPKLNFSFFFDVDEITSFKRKKEYTHKKLRKLRKNFRICSKVLNAYNINGEK